MLLCRGRICQMGRESILSGQKDLIRQRSPWSMHNLRASQLTKALLLDPAARAWIDFEALVLSLSHLRMLRYAPQRFGTRIVFTPLRAHASSRAR